VTPYENGTSTSSGLMVRVVAVTSPPSNNTATLPGQPGLLRASNTTSAQIQTILTLNVTTNATLDLLLAGLIDNTTDGVNGTFQSVTYQIPFFGFGQPVLSALANAPLDGNGTYGPPQSAVPHQSSVSGGFGNWFVNAVTAVVLTPAGHIVSLVELQWTATWESAVLFGHLAIAAAKLGGQLLAETTSAIVNAGRALILSALQVLLAFIYALVENAVNAVLKPVWNACVAYGENLANDLQKSTSDLRSGGSVPGSDSNQFWKDLGSPVFAIALGVSIAVEVVLVVVLGLSLGASLVAGVLFSLLLTAVMTSYLSEASPSPATEREQTQPDATMVWAMSLPLNNTKVNGTLPNDPSDSNYTPGWKAAADTFSWAWSLFSMQWAWGTMMGAFIDPTGVGTAAVGLATGVCALILAFVSLAVHTLFIIIVTLAVAGLSLALDIRSLFLVKGGLSGLTGVMNGITFACDGAALVIEVVENHDHVS